MIFTNVFVNINIRIIVKRSTLASMRFMFPSKTKRR